MHAERDDRPRTPSTTSDPGLEPRDVARELDPDWDDVFAWSYGPRLWNLGCG